MNHLDVINGAFECAGAFGAWANVHRIRKDKSVKGKDWRWVGVWSLWGYWNLHYYGSLGHWISTTAGAVLAVGNSVWVAHAFVYARRERERPWLDNPLLRHRTED